MIFIQFADVRIDETFFLNSYLSCWYWSLKLGDYWRNLAMENSKVLTSLILNLTKSYCLTLSSSLSSLLNSKDNLSVSICFFFYSVPNWPNLTNSPLQSTMICLSLCILAILTKTYLIKGWLRFWEEFLCLWQPSLLKGFMVLFPKNTYHTITGKLSYRIAPPCRPCKRAKLPIKGPPHQRQNRHFSVKCWQCFIWKRLY